MFGGIDIGSKTTKAILLDGRTIAAHAILETGINPSGSGEAALEMVLANRGLPRSTVTRIVGTGYGRVRLAAADRTVTELSCHAAGAHFLDPCLRTLVDIGGQDSKAIRLAPDGSLADFVMNDKCAAGTGRFLETAARVLHTDLATLSRSAAEATRACTINSTCAVFAESEIISLLAAGASQADIVAGLYASFAQRIGNLVRRLKVEPPVALVGGVAKNEGLRRALAENLGLAFRPLPIDPQLVGALGAAVIAQRMEPDRPGDIQN